MCPKIFTPPGFTPDWVRQRGWEEGDTYQVWGALLPCKTILLGREIVFFFTKYFCPRTFYLPFGNINFRFSRGWVRPQGWGQGGTYQVWGALPPYKKIFLGRDVCFSPAKCLRPRIFTHPLVERVAHR